MSWILKLDRALAGQPDVVLTWLLTALSVFGLAVAWLGKPALKAFIAAYFLFP